MLYPRKPQAEADTGFTAAFAFNNPSHSSIPENR
jgi:hypothetical protein